MLKMKKSHFPNVPKKRMKGLIYSETNSFKISGIANKTCAMHDKDSKI